MILRLMLCILFLLLCLFRCAVLSYAVQETTPQEQQVEESPYALQCAEAFVKLRRMFSDPILDENFKTLKQVIGSAVYLDFLRQVYPTDKPFETLEEFMNVAPPPAEKYRYFLNEHFDKPTEKAFLGIHQLTLIRRRANMMLMCAWVTDNPKYRTASIELRSSSFLPNHIKRRLETIDPDSIWSFSLNQEHIKPWFRTRFARGASAEKRKFLHHYGKFVIETEKTDTDGIQARFETDGQSDGLLWIAIEKPILIGEIVTNFPNTDLFLKWVEQTFILNRLSNYEK